MLADALEAVGIERGDYVVRVNNRKVLNGVMEVAGVSGPVDPTKFEAERGIVLRAIDKLDRLGADGVRALAGRRAQGRKRRFHQGCGAWRMRLRRDVVMGFHGCQSATAGAGQRVGAICVNLVGSFG